MVLWGLRTRGVWDIEPFFMADLLSQWPLQTYPGWIFILCQGKDSMILQSILWACKDTIDHKQ